MHALDIDAVRAVVARHRDTPGCLLPALHALQGAFGYVAKEAVPELASCFGLSRAEVHGVLTYYPRFRQQPAWACTLPCRRLHPPRAALARSHGGLVDTDNLVVMVNRIGEFFAAMPDEAEAQEGIARHLRMYWEPRMRRQLMAHGDEHDCEVLLPLVREALRGHRSSLV